MDAFLISTSIVALAENGDKTRLLALPLAARFDALAAVVLGTTLGMMLVNVPAVLLGEIATRKVSAIVAHAIAALIFALLGISVLWVAMAEWMPGR